MDRSAQPQARIASMVATVPATLAQTLVPPALALVGVFALLAIF